MKRGINKYFTVTHSPVRDVPLHHYPQSHLPNCKWVPVGLPPMCLMVSHRPGELGHPSVFRFRSVPVSISRG